MQRYEDLVLVRMAELRAEAEAARAARQVTAVRQAERRYRKAKVRLVSARVHAGAAC